MLYPRKGSDELKCLLCGAFEDRTTLPMLDCDKDKKLFSLIIVALNLKTKTNSKQITLKYSPPQYCFDCLYILELIYVIGMRTLSYLYQLRMKFSYDNNQQPTTSATDDWIRIVKVVSQHDGSSAVSDDVVRKTRSSTFRNGVNGSNKSYRSDTSSDESEVKTKNQNGHGMQTRRKRAESQNGCDTPRRRRNSTRNHIDRCQDGGYLKSPCSSSPMHQELVIQNVIGGYNEDNEIYQINYKAISSPTTTIPTDVVDGQKTPVEKPIQFPKVKPVHQPLLQVLYETRAESVLETESGGRVDKQNDQITCAAKKKFFMCSMCDKVLKNPLMLSRHMVSLHINEKRKAMKESKEQKAALKPFVCSTCHSCFRSQNQLDRHMPQHNRLRCEVCNAEYMNQMDFTWHLAKCMGVSRASIVGIWTRSKSRMSVNDTADKDPKPPPIKKPVKPRVKKPKVKKPPAVSPIAVVRPSSRLSDSAKEKLEKWIEESQFAQAKEQLSEPAAPSKSAAMEQEIRVDVPDEEFDADNEVVQEDEESEKEHQTHRTHRAHTPFPTRRSSVFSSCSRPVTPCSDSHSCTKSRLERWARSDMDSDVDDAVSVCSGFTGISDITARTCSTSSGRGVSRAGSTLSGGSSNWCAQSQKSITTSISMLVNKPRTRNVAKMLKKLELELSFCTSRASQSGASVKSHRRMKKRSILRRNVETEDEFICGESGCWNSYTTLEDVMDHEEKAHKLLRLFRCQECKKKFTLRKYLQKHLLTHETGPFMCIYCDFNFVYTHELQAHFELHRIRSIACEHPGCCKLFLKPADLAEHELTYHVKDVTPEQEEQFVRDFLLQRAAKQGRLGGVGGAVEQRRRSLGCSAEVDVERQTKYAKVLGEMHQSQIAATSTPIANHTIVRDTTGFIPEVAEAIQLRQQQVSQEISNIKTTECDSILNIDEEISVCDSLVNRKSKEYDSISDANLDGTTESTGDQSSSVEELTDHDLSDFDLPSTSAVLKRLINSSRKRLIKKSSTNSVTSSTSKSSSLKKRRKKPRISLTTKRVRSKQVMSMDCFEWDLTVFNLPTYSDLEPSSKPGLMSNVDPDVMRVSPWRVV